MGVWNYESMELWEYVIMGIRCELTLSLLLEYSEFEGCGVGQVGVAGLADVSLHLLVELRQLRVLPLLDCTPLTVGTQRGGGGRGREGGREGGREERERGGEREGGSAGVRCERGR